MGVNIQDVRQIIHYGVPSDLQTYVQEEEMVNRARQLSSTGPFHLAFHLFHVEVYTAMYDKARGLLTNFHHGYPCFRSCTGS